MRIEPTTATYHLGDVVAVTIKLDMRQLGKFEKRLKARFETELNRAMVKAAAEIQSDARQLALRQKIYDLGRFYGGLRAVPKGGNSVTLYNTAKHAVFVLSLIHI